MLKASIIGNLGNDPELRYTANSQPLLRFNVASNGRKRTPGGEFQDYTEWVSVTVFGNRAETLGQYLKKGSRVYAEGRLEASPWTDQQGQVRAGLQMIANEVQFMSSRDDDGHQGGGYNGQGNQQQRQPVPSGSGTRTPQQQQNDYDDGLEDLPF